MMKNLSYKKGAKVWENIIKDFDSFSVKVCLNKDEFSYGSVKIFNTLTSFSLSYAEVIKFLSFLFQLDIYSYEK